MSFLDDVRSWLGVEEPKPPGQQYWLNRQRMAQQSTRAMDFPRDIQTRAIDSYTTYPGWSEQILAAQGLTDRPWRFPSINEALGVPSIFRAVALIANTTGSLAVEAYRKGAKLDDDETPRLVKRPDPFRIPRDFYRDTAFYLATRGEFWWWVAARDIDDSPLSLIVVPPWEIRVERNQADRLRPTIKWLDREMRREDMRHGTFFLDDTGLRGVGPLQLCGAAVSVSVEAQEWAANYFATGGVPSTVVKTTIDLTDEESAAFKAQWIATPNNTPRIITPSVESVTEHGANQQGAQMLEGRDHQNGDAARMFGIPGELLEYSSPGSSLTYQNIAEVFTRFVKSPLAPDYLEPIEQHLSDLLPRSIVSRFNVRGVMRADAKTRAEIYNLLVPLGVMDVEQAQREEGYAPGDIEFAPVPFAPPQAVPTLLPIQQRSVAEHFRCDGTRYRNGILTGCGKLLAGDWHGKCPRCKKEYRDTQLRTVEVHEPTVRDLVAMLPGLIAEAIPRPEAPVVNINPPRARSVVLIPERDAANNITRIVRTEEETDGVVA